MEFLKKFRNWKETEEYPAKSIIFAEGSPAEFLYVILSGEVELNLRGETLEMAKEGDLIGETAITPPEIRSATAFSLTDVKLARLDREQLSRLMIENTDFSLHVMAVLANRLRAVNRFITQQFGSA